MRLHDLFDAACKCLTLDEFPSRRDFVADKFSSGYIPAEDFFLFCDRHLALLPVYRQMREHFLTDSFPPGLVRHLDQIYAFNVQRNNGILQQVEEICADLDKAGIAPVYLKGVAHLLDGLYADAGERLIGDIDILVEDENCLDTFETLKLSGYDLWWRVCGVPEPQSGGGRATRFHLAPLLRADRPASVEVHFKPAPLPFSEDSRTREVFSKKKEIRGRKNCFVPCDEHKIVHNVIHSHLSTPARKLDPLCLRDIYDLYLISRREKPGRVLSQIKEKDRAGGYFLYAAGALGLKHNFDVIENKKVKWHCFVCNIPLKHARISKISRKILFLGHLIFRTYLGNIFQAVVRKSSRASLIRRLRDPQWYRSHAQMLKKNLFH